MTTLFREAFVLPVQYNQSSGFLGAHQALARAILEDALDVAVQVNSEYSLSTRRAAKEAQEWLMKDDEWVFGVTTVCHSLRINVTALRQVVQQRLAGANQAWLPETNSRPILWQNMPVAVARKTRYMCRLCHTIVERGTLYRTSSGSTRSVVGHESCIQQHLAKQQREKELIYNDTHQTGNTLSCAVG